MLHMKLRFWATVFVVTLAVPAAWARQKADPRASTPSNPVPPLSSGESTSQSKPATADGGTTQDPSSEVKADTRPLTGAERYSLGSSARRRSFVLPSFQLTEIGDSNPVNATGTSSVRAASVISGRLTLQNVWSRYQFNAEFFGGGTFYNTTGGINTFFQQLAVSQKIDWRRWSLLFNDNFSYLPDSGFGQGGAFGLPSTVGATLGGALSGNPSNLNGGLIPSQSIYTARARRISNATFGELQYQLSPRSSFTATGSYGFLHFLDPGYLNSRNYQFQTGYNYNLSAKNTLGVIYGVDFFRFDTGVNNFVSHSARVAYGRRITGRLALQVSGGPQISRFKVPTGGSNTVTSWIVLSSLRYELKRSSLLLSYNHFTTGGAGVLYGASSDDVRATLTEHISRLWAGTLNMGFSRNNSITQTIGPTIGPFGFRSWSGGASANRVLGRYASLLFSYDLQRQSNGSCATGACAPSFLRHVFGVGISWNFRPISLD